MHPAKRLILAPLKGVGAARPANTLIVWHGNSLIQGSSETIPPPILLRAMLDDSYEVINEGASGQTTQQLTAELASPAFAAYAATPNTWRVLVLLELRNDMVLNGITPTQAVDNVQAYYAAVPAGFNEVYLCTVPADGSGHANFTPTDWTDANTEIRARYAGFGSVAGAPRLIDIAADARFQDPNDTTIFAGDKIHFVNGGNQALADLVKAAIAPASVAEGLIFNATDTTAASMVRWAGGRAVTKPLVTAWGTARGDVSRSTGNYYFEIESGYFDSSANYMIGLCTAAANNASFLGATANGVGFQGGGSKFATGFDTTGSSHAAFNYGGGAGAPRTRLTAMLNVNFDSGKIWTGYNGVWFGDPVSGTNPAATFTPGMDLFPALTMQNPDNGGWVLHTSAGRLRYDPPPGAAVWDGSDLPPAEAKWNTTEAEVGGFILTDDDRTLSKTGAAWATVRSTLPRLTGKRAFELECVEAGAGTFWVVGLCNYGFASTLLGASAMSVNLTNGTKNGFTGTVANHSELAALGLTISGHVDLDTGHVWEARNGVWRNSGNPAAGTGYEWAFTPGTALFPAISLYQAASGTWKLKGSAADFTYPPEAGFIGWQD